MAVLQLILGPDPILAQKAAPVANIDENIKQLVDDMFDTLYARRGLGIGANMVGELKRIIVVDMQEDGVKNPMTCINPETTWRSETMEMHEEASLCFPGISAEISRADAIKITYQDIEGTACSLSAEGWLAAIIQHEVDYLDGKTYLDYLSRMKRERLLKKMIKQLKHSHSCGDAACDHDHH